MKVFSPRLVNSSCRDAGWAEHSEAQHGGRTELLDCAIALFYCFSFCIFMLTAETAHANSIQWKTLANGISFTVINPTSSSQKNLYAFKINLAHYRFNVVTAKNLQQTSLFASQLTQEKNVLIAINSGFFTPNLKPIGLRINDGKILSPLKHTSWWGVFMIKNNKARIVNQRAYHHTPTINFAIQAGPRLIVNGQIPKLRGQAAQRSALGLTPSGEVIVAITDNRLLLTTTQLATLMKKLGCDNALNLDGGSSSQLSAHINDFSLQIRSLRPVADLILVLKS